MLDANPLDDIRNSEQVRYTMIGGRVFEALTMNELGKPARAPFWFEGEGGETAPPGLHT